MSILATPQSDGITAAQRPRIRLEFLDGLRGIAALYVVLHHFSLVASWLTSSGDWASQSARLLKKSIVLSHFLLFQYGHFAVVIFIVLSGYVLMLPVVQTAGGTLPGGLLDFFKRRARRILPPYYAALGLSLLLLWVLPGLSDVRLSYFHWVFPAFQSEAIITHLFLVHDLFPGYSLRINPPMWSVAVEWQIYFLFPLILLPLWRRFSVVLVVVGAFILGLIPHYVFHRMDEANPWFLGLFALGTFGASVCFSRRQIEQNWLENLPWGFMTLCCAFIFGILNLLQRKSWINVRWLHGFRFETWGIQWPMDVLVGIGSLCFILHCFRFVSQGKHTSSLLRLLAGKTAVGLGKFSYSLYLTHSIVLGIMVLITQQYHLSPPRQGL